MIAAAGLLHAPHTPGQMTYDLRRLRLAGLIRRIERTNTYVLTTDGIKFAVFYTKLHNRLLRPLMAADQAQAPAQLRQALVRWPRMFTGLVMRLWVSVGPSVAGVRCGYGRVRGAGRPARRGDGRARYASAGSPAAAGPARGDCGSPSWP